MTQEEIKAAAEKAMEKVRKRQMQIAVAQLKLRAVQAQCTHPNMYKTSFMGETGWRCPDCQDGD